MDPVAAKEFLISKVVQQAQIDGVPLTEIERKMLYFTEVHPSLPDIYAVNAEFDRDYNSESYEARIAKLLSAARTRDSQQSSDREPEWKDALDALKKEDHYILVMTAEAFGSKANRARDVMIYLGVGIAIVLFIVLKMVFAGPH
jgi:hypothetical protein